MRTHTQEINYIVYEKAFVAFLDVLGFKDMINGDLKKVNRYFNIINIEINHLKSISSKKEIGAIVISDSIILTVPCSEDNEDNIDKLRELCIAIGLIQQRLAIQGIWLRGAISYGDSYFNAAQNQIVGPAYVNAFLLEEELALNPRVILDVKLVHQLKLRNAMDLISRINKMDEGGIKSTNWGTKILFDNTFLDEIWKNTLSNDAPLFIDYLSPLVENKDWVSLKKATNSVRKSMYLDSRIYKKFRWVADYIRALYLIELGEVGTADLKFASMMIDL